MQARAERAAPRAIISRLVCLALAGFLEKRPVAMAFPFRPLCRAERCKSQSLNGRHECLPYRMADTNVCPPGSRMVYMEFCSDVQRAMTLLPTAVMAAMAATT